ncbi:MAG: hypothetical protein ACOY99_06650 [Pseudomonadota bacterium]
MAPVRKKNAARRRPAGPQRSEKAGSGWIFFPLLITLLALFYADASIVLALGMLPTFIAYAVARKGRRGWRLLTLALFNLSGVLPVIFALDGPKYAAFGAMGALGDVYAWFVMYGAAAVGWAVMWLAPHMMAAVMTQFDRLEASKLRAVRAQLIEEWGEAVAEADGGDALAGRADA